MVSFNMDLFTGIKYVYFHKKNSVMYLFAKKQTNKEVSLFFYFIECHTDYTSYTIYFFLFQDI